VWYKNLAIFD